MKAATPSEIAARDMFEHKLEQLFRAVGPHCAWRLAYHLLVALAWSRQSDVIAWLEEAAGDFPKRERGEIRMWIECRNKGL